MIDLAAERQRAREKREALEADRKLDIRARRLRLESKAATLEEGASEIWPELGAEERRNIVARAREQLQEGRVDRMKPEEMIPGPQMVELGAEIFRREPKASSDRVYDVIAREHGAARLGVSRASWVSVYARQARKAAGVAKKPAPKKKHKPAADHPWRHNPPAKDEEPSEAERPGEATDSSAGAELAEPVAAPAAPISGGTLTSSVDAPAALELSAPGTGFLRATAAREGGWLVTYEGHADGGLLDDLVRALSGAVTGAGRDAA